MNTKPLVISEVVDNDLCIGCGLCVFKCPSNSLEMKWNEYGFLVPNIIDDCNSDGACLSVCPFNPQPEAPAKTENELASLHLIDTTEHHEKIGKFTGLYAGHSEQFRDSSSSGGMGTYIFDALLEKGIVDHVFSVGESNTPGIHYEYVVKSSRKDLLEASKTKYIPVTLASVLPEIYKLDGKIAIVGVACFIKAIRLAQSTDPYLKEKIPFLVGIICGGVKSKFFTEYLASKIGVDPEQIQTPQYRVKDITSSAHDYSFSCRDGHSNEQKLIKLKTVGDMWGTGLFKANACDFCDDVTTELADISLGDAWLEPFNKDGNGTNVIVSRSKLADEIIQEGMKSGKIHAVVLPLERFLASQQGSYNHRHNGLSVRLEQRNNKKLATPPKRFGQIRVGFDFKLVQKMRMIIRKKSLELWKKTPSHDDFDKKMYKYLYTLRLLTRMYHYKRSITKNLQKKILKK